jgi:uncharacterized membrane protein (DUF485 family)
MVGLDHGGNEPAEDDSPLVAARNARVGLVLFAIYLFFYAAFVLISAFNLDWMAQRPGGGVNLAIWSGFGLLAGALAMALVYSWLCRERNAS